MNETDEFGPVMLRDVVRQNRNNIARIETYLNRIEAAMDKNYEKLAKELDKLSERLHALEKRVWVLCALGAGAGAGAVEAAQTLL